LLEKILSTDIQNTSKKAESSQKRETNIHWIVNLPRKGLAFRQKTRQILITKTQYKERIYIQYPGKESARSNDKLRPWDFFPRIKSSKSYLSDLDFKAIWDILFEGLQTLLKDNLQWSNVFSTVFYRMAFMNDHILSDDPFKTTVNQILYDKKGKEIVKEVKIKKLPLLYQYSPDKKMIKMVTDIVPLWGGMSFEAFLHYNDLLAWNEDCKYFYRMQNEKPNNWIRNTGRINTLLSHLSIIGYVSGKIKFSDICIKFARGKGVAPATREEIFRLCNGYILK